MYKLGLEKAEEHRDQWPTFSWGFPGSSAGKESTCNEGDPSLILGLGRSNPREGIDYPLQYSGLENSMDCIVHGVTKSLTRLSSDLHFQFLDHRESKGIPEKHLFLIH